MRATLSLLASLGLGVARAMVSPTSAKLVFEPPTPAIARKYVLCGTASALLSDGAKNLLPLGLPIPRWKYLVQQAEEGAGNSGATSTWMFTGADGKPSTIIAAVLPEACSRHASPVRPHAITSLVKGSSKSSRFIVVLEDESHAGGAACALGRAFPLYSAKRRSAVRRRAASALAEDTEVAPGDEEAGGGDNGPPVMTIAFATKDGPLSSGYDTFSAAAEGVRQACRLVDLPPASLTTTAFVGEALAAAERLNAEGATVETSVLSGDALREAGYGFLHGVGKAAEEPPALVVLSHVPEGGSGRSVCLVGKGIVYDTGGLSLKSKEGMPGMKADMGGAAATLAAFEAAVRIGTEGQAIHLVLCLAENAIGPGAMRNDDILTCLSGLTCEINNSDAEGRLVLSDGVAHATAIPSRLPGLPPNGQPDLLIDMATLTGAQLIATGKRHAGIVSNTEEVERQAVLAGRLSGDTVHPLPFVPEWYAAEFESKVADMKNSVKDRSNAQSSCAANFIYEHIHPEFNGGWLHVDLAGPAFIEDRGTGFGVGLALAMLGCKGFRPPPPTSSS